MHPNQWEVYALADEFDGPDTFAVFADDHQLSDAFPTREEAEAERKRLAAIPQCAVCGDKWGDPLCADPGHCEACGELKFGTGPRERTCGKAECSKRCGG